MKQKRSHTHKNEHRLARLSSSSHAAYSKMKHSFTSGSQSQRLHVLHNKRSLRIVLVVFGFVLILGIILIVRTCTSAPSQATESNNAASEESASDSSSENEIVTTTTPEGITFTGHASFPDSDAYATLVAAIDTFESNGFSLGFTLTDIDSGNSISYNADQTFYSASTIKAPYVIALYESNEHSMNYLGSSETVQNCLVYSDNEAYESLRNSYGSTFMYDWLVAAGFSEEDAQALYGRGYADITPNQLAAMWLHAYDYLTSGSANALQLQEYLEVSENSCIHALTTDTYTAWTKPGWYPSSDLAATNDAGIVQSDSGTYVVAIMSNAPQDFAALIPVVDAVNMAHGELTGGSTSSLITPQTQIPSDS